MLILRLFCISILLALSAIQIHYALYTQTEYSRNENVSALHKYQTNPYLLTWLGKQKHLFEADLEMAKSLYQKALVLNPVYVPAWLGLAEVQSDRRDKQNANAILEYCNSLLTDVKRWRWDMALVAYQFDRKDILAQDLSYIIREIPGKVRNDALRMAFSQWPDTNELQEQLGDDVLEHLFRYAIRKRKVVQGLILWDTFKTEEFENKEKETLTFVNMLMRQGEVESAATIWRKYINPSSLFFNGDFSKAPLQTAFGWIIKKTKGSRWYLQKGTKNVPHSSLHFHFKRLENTNLYKVYQVVPLQGGKVYALKGEIKTKSLTTDQLPFIEAYGYKCKAPRNKTDMVSSNQDWTPIYLLFEVPEECDAMVIRLRRRESTRIDNKLAGDIWLAKFSITETEELFTILDEKQ